MGGHVEEIKNEQEFVLEPMSFDEKNAIEQSASPTSQKFGVAIPFQQPQAKKKKPTIIPAKKRKKAS